MRTNWVNVPFVPGFSSRLSLSQVRCCRKSWYAPFAKYAKDGATHTNSDRQTRSKTWATRSVESHPSRLDSVSVQLEQGRVCDPRMGRYLLDQLWPPETLLLPIGSTDGVGRVQRRQGIRLRLRNTSWLKLGFCVYACIQSDNRNLCSRRSNKEWTSVRLPISI